MSRSRTSLYLRSVVTGYGLLVLNTAYSLATVPLALHYLGAKTFGLWALTTQIGAIMQLADVGMTGALSRILIEYKDDKSSQSFRETFYTMWLALTVVGIVVAGGLAVISGPLISGLAIPSEFAANYKSFLIAYAALWALGFCSKPFDILPYIHQRADISNLIAALGMIVSFGVVWGGLSMGWGLWSFLAGQALSQLMALGMNLQQGWKRRFLPARRAGSKLSLRAFREVFSYGKDRFFITLGYTTLQAVPTFLITRLLGLDANTAWSVGTKASQLCFLVITRISDLSYPVLAEMNARGEYSTLSRRFNQLMVMGGALACFCAAGIASCNSDFVTLWTNGKVSWNSHLDLLLAVYLVTQTLQRFLYVPVGVTRNLKGIRFMYLIESMLTAFLISTVIYLHPSLSSIIVILAVSSLLVSIPASLKKCAQLLGGSWLEPLRPIVRTVAWGAIPLTISHFATRFLATTVSWPHLVVKALLIGLLALVILCMVREIRGITIELANRLGLKKRHIA